MFGTAFWTVAAWLSTSAFFIGIPVAISLRRDARAAGTRAVIRRRFFLPIRRTSPLGDDLAGRTVWLEHWSRAHGRHKGPARVIAVRDRTLLLDVAGTERTFAPRFESSRFATGTGAATGTLDDDEALVIWTV